MNQETRQALVSLIAAERAHDAAAVLAMLASPEAELLRGHLATHRQLARSVMWTAGLPYAAAELASVCAHPGPADDERENDSAFAAQANAVRRLPLHRVAGLASVAPMMLGHELPIIEVTIASRAGQAMIVDTGAPTTLFSRRFCDRAQLPYTPTPRWVHDGAGNRLPLFATLVPSLRIGALEVRDLTADVADFPASFGVAGILAPLDTLRHADVELSFRRRELRVAPAGAARAEIAGAGERVLHAPLVWEDGSAHVHGELGDTLSGHLLLDSGAGANIVSPEAARALGSDDAAVVELSGPTLAGKVTLTSAVRAELSVAGEPRRLAEFLVKPLHQSPDALLPLDQLGFIGVPWLGSRRVWLPAGGMTMAFTLPG